MIDRGVDYDVGSRTGRRGQPIEVLSVGSRNAVLDELVTVHLSILDHDDLRGALKTDAQGRSPRGDLAALQRLMAAA